MNNPFLRADNITKIFGETIANDSVNLKVERGEVHAILGENGAGKSTLMNMISGIYLPDKGSMYLNGEKVDINSPSKSMSLGIGMIHQRFKLVNVMTGLENILLGQEKRLVLNKKKNKRDLEVLMAKYNIEIDLSMLVRDMSMGQKQILEIIKVLNRGAKLLILDEPTTVLTPQEIQTLFNIINNLKEKGHSIIFISHKLNEVMTISDRITILRKGKTISTVKTAETNPMQLTELMVGKPVELKINRVTHERGEEVLQLKNVITYDNNGLKNLDDVSFSVYAGEILGVAGISGHGQKPLCDVITGILPLSSGEVYVDGHNITNKSVKEIAEQGIRISYVPQDRLGMGLVPSMSISENILLKDYREQGFLLDRTNSENISREIIDELDVQTTGINQPVSLMSGGNIQKILIGRELKLKPSLLITAYPVRGLDINTTYKIYDLINSEKDKGVAVLYLAEDLDSLIGLCDRILVLHHGKVADIVDAKTATKEQIGLLMLGNKEK